MDREETIYRQDVLDLAKKGVLISNGSYKSVCKAINELPPVNPQEPKTDSWSIKDVVDTFKKHGLIREQEPCEDAISREWLKTAIHNFYDGLKHTPTEEDIQAYIDVAPPVTQKSGKCKNCKYFEYDSVAKVEGVTLIVAHEICKRWGDGCKTKEDGYCFLYEPQERSEKE